MKKIKLKDLSIILGLKTTDKARLWCLKNNIEIFGKNTQRYVLEMDVAVEVDTDGITYLVKKYGDNWALVYQLYRDNNFEGLINLKFANLLAKGSRMNERIVVGKSDSAQKFLKNIA